MNNQIQSSVPSNPLAEGGVLTVKALLSLLPIAGGVATTLLEGIVTPIFGETKE